VPAPGGTAGSGQCDIFYPGQAQTGEFGPWYPVDNPTGLVRTGNTWCDGPLAGQPVNE
jgi:hypothetical protein